MHEKPNYMYTNFPRADEADNDSSDNPSVEQLFAAAAFKFVRT